MEKNQKVELRIVNKEAIQRARDKKMKEKERAVKIEAWLNEILEKLELLLLFIYSIT